jgi:hypothetical protein
VGLDAAGKGLRARNWPGHDSLLLEFTSVLEMGVRCHVEVVPFRDSIFSVGDMRCNCVWSEGCCRMVNYG